VLHIGNYLTWVVSSIVVFVIGVLGCDALRHSDHVPIFLGFVVVALLGACSFLGSLFFRDDCPGYWELRLPTKEESRKLLGTLVGAALVLSGMWMMSNGMFWAALGVPVALVGVMAILAWMVGDNE